jgi:hypothetical protein
MAFRNKFRFYVVDGDKKIRSAIWKIVFSNKHLYIFPGKLSPYFKLSIHPKKENFDKDSQIGLKNNYSEELVKKGYKVPKVVRWLWISPTDKEIKCIASIFAPTDFSRPPNFMSNQRAKYDDFKLPISNPGQAVRVDIFCSRINPATVKQKIALEGMKLITHACLSETEYIFLTYRHIEFDAKAVNSLEDKNGNFYPLSDKINKEGFTKKLCAVLFSEPKKEGSIELCDVYGLSIKKKK